MLTINFYQQEKLPHFLFVHHVKALDMVVLGVLSKLCVCNKHSMRRGSNKHLAFLDRTSSAVQIIQAQLQNEGQRDSEMKSLADQED